MASSKTPRKHAPKPKKRAQKPNATQEFIDRPLDRIMSYAAERRATLRPAGEEEAEQDRSGEKQQGQEDK